MGFACLISHKELNLGCILDASKLFRVHPIFDLITINIENAMSFECVLQKSSNMFRAISEMVGNFILIFTEPKID